MKKIELLSREKTIAIFIFVMGLIFSVMIPTWQIPDEMAHIEMIGNAIGVENIGEIFEEEIPLVRGRIEFQYNEKVDLEEQKEALVQTVTYKRGELLPKKISFSVIKHLPATIGIELGILLGVPVYWVLMLGELFALLFYTIMCYMALSIMPIKKEVLEYVMLFPMALQQAGSLSYDAVLLPLCFVFVAYVFYLKYGKESVGLKEALLLLITLFLIAYIKVPYVFIGLLIFLIPLKKINIDLHVLVIDSRFIKKAGIPVCILIMLLGGIGIYFFQDNLWVQVVYGFVAEWRRSLWLFYSTGVTLGKSTMISTVGNFGWLDTPMNIYVVYAIFLFLVLISLARDEKTDKLILKKSDVLIILFAFGMLCVFTAMSMSHHTIMTIMFGSEAAPATYKIREALYEIPFIGGLQGRYFLPCVPLLFLIFPPKITMKRKWRHLCFWIVEIAMYSYSIWLLLDRYWLP